MQNDPEMNLDPVETVRYTEEFKPLSDAIADKVTRALDLDEDPVPTQAFEAIALLSSILYLIAGARGENVLLATAKVLFENPDIEAKVWEEVQKYV